MPTRNYSAADFATAMVALMPPGLAWPRDPASTQHQTIAGLAPIYQRSTARANNLLVDAFPATAVELLTEWESTVGIPDPQVGQLPTIQQRQAAVVSRLTNTGGQSAPYYISYAAKLGYAVSVTCYTPFRMGQQRMGQPLGGPEWAHTWAINAPLTTVTSFRMGISFMSEPLQTWGNTLLQIELSEIKPAHTILQFHYS